MRSTDAISFVLNSLYFCGGIHPIGIEKIQTNLQNWHSQKWFYGKVIGSAQYELRLEYQIINAVSIGDDTIYLIITKVPYAMKMSPFWNEKTLQWSRKSDNKLDKYILFTELTRLFHHEIFFLLSLLSAYITTICFIYLIIKPFLFTAPLKCSLEMIVIAIAIWIMCLLSVIYLAV